MASTLVACRQYSLHPHFHHPLHHYLHDGLICKALYSIFEGAVLGLGMFLGGVAVAALEFLMDNIHLDQLLFPGWRITAEVLVCHQYSEAMGKVRNNNINNLQVG